MATAAGCERYQRRRTGSTFRLEGSWRVMGSTERELLRTGVRYSLGLRMVIFLVISLVALIFESAPEPAVLVSVTVVLNGWTAWYAFRFRRRGRWLVPADVAVVCAVCATQVWTVPPGVSAEGIRGSSVSRDGRLPGRRGCRRPPGLACGRAGAAVAGDRGRAVQSPLPPCPARGAERRRGHRARRAGPAGVGGR